MRIFSRVERSLAEREYERIRRIPGGEAIRSEIFTPDRLEEHGVALAKVWAAAPARTSRSPRFSERIHDEWRTLRRIHRCLQRSGRA
jgi:hypothetical protein